VAYYRLLLLLSGYVIMFSCINLYLHSTPILLNSNVIYITDRTIILSVVLYRWDTWSLTLSEERRLMVYENGVLRIFGPKTEEVTEEWIKLHKEELNDL